MLRSRAICLASKISHSEICSAYIFLAWCSEIHSKCITLALISLGKKQNITFHNTTLFCYILQMTRYHFSVNEFRADSQCCSVHYSGKSYLPFLKTSSLPTWSYSSTLSNLNYSVMHDFLPQGNILWAPHSVILVSRRGQWGVYMLPQSQDGLHEQCFDEVRLWWGSD